MVMMAMIARWCGSTIPRSSHQKCSIKKGVFKNFVKFTGIHLCQSLFFNKVAGLKPVTLLKKRPWHRHFALNFAKFFKNIFSQNTSGRLLLHTTKTFTIITINYFHKKHIFDVYQYLIELNKQKTPLKSLPFPTLKSMYVSMSPLH